MDEMTPCEVRGYNIASYHTIATEGKMSEEKIDHAVLFRMRKSEFKKLKRVACNWYGGNVSLTLRELVAQATADPARRPEVGNGLYTRS
jgi:sulfatase maturation enzyme AslB (radical SAM superfamily)